MAAPGLSTLSGKESTSVTRGMAVSAAVSCTSKRILSSSPQWPTNLARLLAGGINDRSNLAATLDADVFGGATFADLYRRNKPDVWINATDLYNRTPFPFIPPVFAALCSDLSRLRVSEAVAASMAVPLAFAPVALAWQLKFPGARAALLAAGSLTGVPAMADMFRIEIGP